ncbi:biotin transport system substrate-specific component [Streptosporangium becharense]|uniref:Biotin transporter n=1 Tax=Streptosporangium becharense TaxID=1816182 RepID=A0A7W9IIT4_9ACTN|nr:biotin transporter BioY [Streptosporangium becharense]MBB2913520.1 biotin transport system substrate-specific component [Streptosporangium becharense]MBB5821210.1 biotin transport system substrate-specific component [Streptosporangium becharense]
MANASSVARPAVLSDLIPASRVRDVALVLGGAALTGLAAQLSFPLPGSPVPVSGQTFAVVLVGAALGMNRAVLSMAIYLLAGVAGMPWFAEGASGFGGASFGYVIGFVAAAAVVGKLAEHGGDRTALRTVGTMVAGNMVIYAFGLPVLIAVAQVGPAEGLALGVLPFLLGDALKIAVAAGLLPAAWKLAGR